MKTDRIVTISYIILSSIFLVTVMLCNKTEQSVVFTPETYHIEKGYIISETGDTAKIKDSIIAMPKGIYKSNNN